MGGYLLEGGISFLSAQYGLAADVSMPPSSKILGLLISLQKIVGWETVRSDRSIVQLNAEKQPRLATAVVANSVRLHPQITKILSRVRYCYLVQNQDLRNW